MNLDFIFFQVYPYVAFTIFVVATWIRYDREQYSWNARSSQILSDKWFVLGNNLFHWCIIMLLSAHFVGLLTPEVLYKSVISAHHKQILAMTAGGILGTICWVGMTMLVLRRLFNPRVRANSRPSDIMILLVLYLQLMLGLSTIHVSAKHLDGVDMEALANWVQHIVTFRTDAYLYLQNINIIFKIHLFVGMTLFVLFPFTRLVHIVIRPLQYLIRTGYQIVRK